MIIEVTPDGWLSYSGRRFRCALGPGGVRPDKREGDGATPRGDFPLRRVLFREDRISRPKTALPITPIGHNDGWCDDPADPNYNRHVTLPYEARCETLWRDDTLYDLIVVLGYNDDPVLPGKGSAIFMHVAAPDFAPTEGCVAITLEDLLTLIESADTSTVLRVC